MSLADIVAAGIEPQVRVAFSCTILLAVVQHSFQHPWNSAIMTTTITCRQNDNIAIPRLPRIALPAIAVVGHLPVPFGLCFEVAFLWFIVVRCHRHMRSRLPWRVIPVVFEVHRDIIKQPEEDYKDRDCCYREYYGPIQWWFVSTN